MATDNSNIDSQAFCLWNSLYQLLRLSCLLLQIFKHKEKIQDISTTASNEATLENMLQKVHVSLCWTHKQDCRLQQGVIYVDNDTVLVLK